MTRIKRGVTASKRRKKVLKLTKGFRWRRKSHYRAAKEAMFRAGKYAYRDRRAKKRTNRSLWIIRINNAARINGITYRELVSRMKNKKIILDRKVLSDLAVSEPAIFSQLIKKIVD